MAVLEGERVGGEQLVRRAVVADQVDEESPEEIVGDALVFVEVEDVEKVARVLAVERGGDLSGVEIGERDDLHLRIAEPVLDRRTAGEKLRLAHRPAQHGAQDRKSTA